jgi:hypothetical protein
MKMKKIILATTLLLFVSGCGQESTTQPQVEQNELSVIDKLPDFPISLTSFVDGFNSNKDDFNNLSELTNVRNIDFQEFNEKDGTLMKELVKTDGYDLKAIFTNKKKFKRLIFSNNGDSLPQENAVVLVNTFYTIGVDPNYLNDFLDSGESIMEIAVNGYKINFWFERSLGLLNITFDSEI